MKTKSTKERIDDALFLRVALAVSVSSGLWYQFGFWAAVASAVNFILGMAAAVVIEVGNELIGKSR